ncbi:MAG: hypothetical protein IJV78_01230 [Clostridia bacterium]|nr:hypothetical protein [Clostridia bacterium]
MEHFDAYQFVLCLIVFIILTVSFTTLTAWLIKLYRKLISAGVNDEKIKQEYIKAQEKRPSIAGKVFDKLLLGLCCVAMLVMFGFSLSVTFNEGKITGDVPVLNVVKSKSMSYINDRHGFLEQGEVNDQIQMFDLVFIHKLPAEDDLNVHDIVVYETDGYLIIHRIVAIEERNEKHPNERYFLLQGDANEVTDRFPVRYSQMKGLYAGERLPFIGSFVMFMQSPAGWLCVLLIVFAIVATAIAEKKIQEEINKRLMLLGLLTGTTTDSSAQQSSALTTSACITANESLATISTDADNAITNDSVTEQLTEDIYILDDRVALDTEGATEQSLNETVAILDTEDFDQQLTANQTEQDSDVDKFGSFGKGKSFAEKLTTATEPLLSRYQQISDYLGKIKNIRVIRGRRFETYRCGNIAICRLSIRGKTLNAYMALDPMQYVNTKYIFENVSHKSIFKNYPMRIKLSSDRKTKWTKELVAIIAKHNGWIVEGKND